MSNYKYLYKLNATLNLNALKIEIGKKNCLNYLKSLF